MIDEPPIDEWSRAAVLRHLAWAASDDAACLCPSDFARELLRRLRRLTADQRRLVAEKMLEGLQASDDGRDG